VASESARKWIEAARRTLEDDQAEIACPECSASPMDIFTVPIGNSKFERHLYCPRCGAYNAILYRRDGP
jgi:Zn finger protein HypA/HybF involved in hydrogenase expression